jgi:capsular exopolysaccharide synthesis family protein
VNLAIVMSMSLERKVLLIDADLRKPKIHRTLGLDPLAGLAEVLMGEAELDKAVVRPEGLKLDVLGVRGLPPNPAELLASSRMRQLLEDLGRRYDTLVIDTPPTLSLPDSKTVSEMCDGIVFVVRANETPQEEVQAALDVLERRRVVGLVLNGAEVDEQRYRYA